MLVSVPRVHARPSDGSAKRAIRIPGGQAPPRQRPRQRSGPLFILVGAIGTAIFFDVSRDMEIADLPQLSTPAPCNSAINGTTPEVAREMLAQLRLGDTVPGERATSTEH